jgi:uncharacterized Zn finger protein (UPF0148 family)
MSRNQFCPKTGNPHNALPSEYVFCPTCQARLSGGEKEKEVIVLDETPEKLKSERTNLVVSACPISSHTTQF